jgi:hypothetical protein
MWIHYSHYLLFSSFSPPPPPPSLWQGLAYSPGKEQIFHLLLCAQHTVGYFWIHVVWFIPVLWNQNDYLHLTYWETESWRDEIICLIIVLFRRQNQHKCVKWEEFHDISRLQRPAGNSLTLLPSIPSHLPQPVSESLCWEAGHGGCVGGGEEGRLLRKEES